MPFSGAANRMLGSFPSGCLSAQAICFRNYHVGNSLAWEHGGFFAFRRPSAFICESHTGTQSPSLDIFVPPKHKTDSSWLFRVLYVSETTHDRLSRAWVWDTYVICLLSPCHFSKSNQLMDAALFQNKARLWLRS